MALYTSKNLLCLYNIRYLVLQKLQPFLHINVSQVHWSSKNDESETLDQFTTQMMERKSGIWERRKLLARKKIQSNQTVIETPLADNLLAQLSSDAINDLFYNELNHEDHPKVVQLIKQCVKCNKIPSVSLLLRALTICASSGDKDSIREVAELCGRIRPDILVENCNFEHYDAQAIWIKGNVVKALEMFGKVYRENVYLRRYIRSIIKHLISLSMDTHSEAMIVNVLNFSDELILEYNDYFILASLWQSCILSKWFTDQQFALDLLLKYAKLKDVISDKIVVVVEVCLRHHQTEVVYRLTEVLLQLNCRNDIGKVLVALLDYSFRQTDFRQCKEIILWAVEHDIEMPTVFRNKKLVQLFSRDIKNVTVKSDMKQTKPVPDYKF
ncbi:uncharacterized protein LOC126742743 isoform X1 [Anthonomus grandis grandis]|uniref:uncharacterized protein LOC126742743 isoform X1 n=1 Tax=Anthonomus grandis grandis TaxID=2921223 RepID=UPI0021666698|nr:uncharacterized protein LOC126742743 isoform X1 [Anthonomus grandis grandis]XP_050305487.1 uncharacterized protein LOC126742743 isoform X1 [Anthonomus grandis grandis]XP_050305488.1 uncharacterized protein LOC126742743 isoform X1 [Anthonomus grandis grandis]